VNNRKSKAVASNKQNLLESKTSLTGKESAIFSTNGKLEPRSLTIWKLPYSNLRKLLTRTNSEITLTNGRCKLKLSLEQLLSKTDANG
jgi:hypothetical protein